MELDENSADRSRASAVGRFIRSAAVAGLLSMLAVPGSAAEPLTRLTEDGHYRVSLRPVPDVPPIARLHSWIVHVETSDGETFAPRQLGITGGMPGHAHGMVSEPRVTDDLGGGDYLIEGMKFNMGGNWRLIVGVAGPGGYDKAVFELSLAAGPAEFDHATLSWPDGEVAFLRQFTLDRLGRPADASNRYSGNPRAAELGQALFFDRQLSASGKVSCASCHEPARKFTDGRKKSFGSRETTRHAPTLVGVAHGDWFYWDGRRDSLWAQTITPIETPGEMDNNRVDAVAYLMQQYGDHYESLAGERLDIDRARFPGGAGPFASGEGGRAWRRMRPEDREAINHAFADIGKFLAAYIETLEPRPSRFDAFVAALTEGRADEASRILDEQEQAGLKLFFDASRTQCLRCHNGPMFSNYGFHNIATGVAEDGTQDYGRMFGLQAAKRDEFNCRGLYSDARLEDCVELRFFDSVSTAPGAFKVPTLRNVGLTAPYMHDGRFDTLEEVVEFYTRVPDPAMGPHELPLLDLSGEEMRQLVAFLKTLSDETAR